MVERVYINTYRRDFWFAKICIASIRYWYPDLPIRLIKDFGAGDFDTSFLSREMNVDVMNTGRKSFGWGFGKFEPLFQDQRERFLFVDADTVMLGPVLDHLPKEFDFVVDEENLAGPKIDHLYFDRDKLAKYDPEFVFPGYAFNTGQWVGTSGILQRSDFDPHIQWEPVPHLVSSDLFKQADQGILNYILLKKAQAGNLTLKRSPIMVWPAEGRSNHIHLDPIKAKRDSYPLIMHFAGMKGRRASAFPHADILNFYTRYYYQFLGTGTMVKDELIALSESGQELLASIWRKLSR